MDTRGEDAHKFHKGYRDRWRRGWPELTYPIARLPSLCGRESLLWPVGRYSPPLWLPDHVAGTLTNWANVELQVDRAAAIAGSHPKAGRRVWHRHVAVRPA